MTLRLFRWSVLVGGLLVAGPARGEAPHWLLGDGPIDPDRLAAQRELLRDLLTRAAAPGAGVVPRPQEQELADLFLAMACRAHVPSVLTLSEDQFVALAQEVITGETEELRRAAVALHEASRSTLDAKTGDGEIWLDATSRRALEGLELLGRQWVRLIAEKQADSGARAALAQGPEARAILAELDRLLERHELEVLVRRLKDRSPSRLLDLVDGVKTAGRAEPSHLDTLLEIAVEAERQAGVGFTSLLANPEQWRKACRRAEGLSLWDLTTGNCQGRLEKLAKAWTAWQAGRPAGDLSVDGGDDVEAFASWLKERFFLYRVLLSETGAVEATPRNETSAAPVSLREEALQPALARLHGRLREVAAPSAQDAESAARSLAVALLAQPGERVTAVRDLFFPESGGGTEREVLRELFGLTTSDAVDEPLLTRLVPAAERALVRADLIADLMDGVLLPWPDASSATTADVCLGTAPIEPGIVGGEIQTSLELLIGLRPARDNGASEPCGGPWLRTGLTSPPLRVSVSLDGAVDGARQAIETSLADLARQATYASPALAGLHTFVGRAGVPASLPLGGASFAWDRGLRLEVRGECVEILPPGASADAPCEGVPLADLTSAYALREPAERIVRRILVREAEPRIAERLAAVRPGATAEMLEEARTAIDAVLRDPARPLVCDGTGCGVRAPLPGPRGRLGDSAILVRLSSAGAVDLTVEVGTGDALAAILGKGGPLAARHVAASPDGITTADAVLTDGRRDLLRLGRMTVRQGTVEIENQVIGERRIELGGGFGLELEPETRFVWKTSTLEISEVRLSGPRPFGRVDGLTLTVASGNDGLRWDLDDASVARLGAAVRGWLSQLGIWPQGLAPGLVAITSDGLRLDFSGVLEPLRSCASSLAAAPLNDRWITSLPERLRSSGACAGSLVAAELDNRLAELRKLLEANLSPRAEVWRFGRVDLGPLGSVGWKCDESGALSADSYGSCVIEIRSAALACEAGPDLVVTISTAAEAQVDSAPGKECLRRVLEERLGGAAALAGEIQTRYVREEHRVALAVPVHLAGMTVPVELRIGLDGDVRMRVDRPEELARAVEGALEEARAELRKQIDQGLGDVTEAVESWRKDLEKELGVEVEVLEYFEDVPGLRTGASVRICHPGLAGGPPLCASGVRLSFVGKVVDFSHAEVDRAALDATLRGLLPGMGDDVSVTAVVPERDKIRITAEARFRIDPFPQPLVAEIQLGLGRNGLAANMRADLLEPAAQAIRGRIDKLSLEEDGWKLAFTSVEADATCCWSAWHASRPSPSFPSWLSSCVCPCSRKVVSIFRLRNQT